MRRILFLIFIVVAVSVFAEGELVPIRIPDFSAGLDTRNLHIPLGAGRAVHNFDLTKNFGALTLRDGYDSVFSFPGLDSILWNGLYAGKYSDGNKQLFVIGDSAGVGYANIYASDLNTINFGATDSFLFAMDPTDLTIDTTFDVSSIDTTTTILCRQCIQRKPSSSCAEPPCACTEWQDVDCDEVFDEADEGPYDTTIVIDTTLGAVNSIDTTYAQTWEITIFVAGTGCAGIIAFSASSTDSFGITEACSLLATQINADDCGSFVTATVDTTGSDTTLIIVEDAANTNAIFVVSSTVTLVNSGSLTPSHRIATKFPATGIPKWTTYRDRVYIVNGVSKGIVFDGKYSYSLPLRAPGEPEVVPLNTSGNLNGTYRYFIRSLDDSNTTFDSLSITHIGRATTPIVATNQQILLSSFPPPNVDTLHKGADTVKYQIWRTVGDVGNLDALDSMWVVDTITITGGAYIDSSYTDNTSDVTLRTQTNNYGRIIADTGLYLWEPDTANGGGEYLFRHITRPGAPTIFQYGSRADSGIWGGDTAKTDWSIVAGWSYGVVFVDTNQNSPSAMGPRFEFYQKNKTDTYDTSCFDCAGATRWTSFARNDIAFLKLVLPRTTDTNMTALLYRGAISPISLDSLEFYRYEPDYIHVHIKGDRDDPGTFLWADSFAVLSYNLIGTYQPGDTITDTLTYDSLLNRIAYRTNNIPPLVDNIMSHDNRLFMSNRNTVFYEESGGDAGLVFNLMAQAPINKDDGQRIVGMWPGKEVVHVAKTGSKYQMFQSGSDSWRPFELSANYGMISALSHIAAPEGDYFLSGDGVRLEVEGLNKSRSFVGSLVSQTLKSFDNMKTSEKQKSIAAYIDNKYMLSFPAIGTTFVANKLFSEQGQRLSWTTWSMTFAGWAQYGVGSSNELLPDDTGYFIKSNSTSLFRYGASTTDNGTVIAGKFRSGDLGPKDGNVYAMRDVGLWVTNGGSVDSSWAIVMYNDKGVVVPNAEFVFGPLGLHTFHYFEQGALEEYLFWSFEIRSNPSFEQSGVPLFEGVDITFINRGKIKPQ